MDADHSDHFAARRNGDAEVRSGGPSHRLDADLGAVAFHIFVDQQWLAGADDLRGQAPTEGSRFGLFAVGIGELEHHPVAIQRRDVGNRRMEQVAHLVTYKLDKAIHIKLAGEGLRDAVDGPQFGRTFADLGLALVDHPVGTSVIRS